MRGFLPLRNAYWAMRLPARKLLLERADTSLDEFSGAIKRLSPGRELLSSASRPYKSMGLLGSQDLPKPQLSFEHRFTNTESGPFKPLLQSKPHAAVPFEDSLVLHTAKSGQKHYGHPYRPEIEKYEYPPFVYTRAEPIQYQAVDATTATFVDTEEAVEEMLKELENAKEIAVDLEHHDTRSYVGVVCLMQISTRDKDWIVDTLKPWRHKLSILNKIFADPNILKVLHGAHMDTIWLQRDLGIYIVGLFDTHLAARTLGYPGGSLAFLLKRFANFDAQKQYQMADWRIRPLPHELLEYARSDTHYLLYIYDNMRNELLDRSSLAVPDKEHDKIHTVCVKSKELSLQLFHHPSYDADRGLGSGGWYKLLNRTPIAFSRDQFCVFRAIHQWRDNVAREQDDGLHHVLPNHVMFTVAKEMPNDQAALFNVARPLTQTVKLRADELLEVIAKAKASAIRAVEMREVLTEIDTFLHGTPLVTAPATLSQPASSTMQETHSSKKPESVKGILQLSSLRSTLSALWGSTSVSPGDKKDFSTLHPQMVIPLPPFDVLASAPPTTPADHTRVSTAHATLPTEDTASDEVFTLHTSVTKRKADALTTTSADGLVAQSDEIDLDEANADLSRQQEEKRQRKAERKAAKRAKRANGSDGHEKNVGVVGSGEAMQPFDYTAAPSVLNAQDVQMAEALKERKEKPKDSRAKKEPFSFAKGLNDVAKGLGRRQKERAGKSMTFRD